MANITEAATVLKAAHFNAFSSESLKAKMFIIQLNNKIMDAAEVINRWKIYYAMLLLWGPVLKWAVTFING